MGVITKPDIGEPFLVGLDSYCSLQKWYKVFGVLDCFLYIGVLNYTESTCGMNYES